jgi:hypothetical protein
LDIFRSKEKRAGKYFYKIAQHNNVDSLKVLADTLHAHEKNNQISVLVVAKLKYAIMAKKYETLTQQLRHDAYAILSKATLPNGRSLPDAVNDWKGNGSAEKAFNLLFAETTKKLGEIEGNDRQPIDFLLGVLAKFCVDFLIHKRLNAEVLDNNYYEKFIKIFNLEGSGFAATYNAGLGLINNSGYGWKVKYGRRVQNEFRGMENDSSKISPAVQELIKDDAKKRLADFASNPTSIGGWQPRLEDVE